MNRPIDNRPINRAVYLIISVFVGVCVFLILPWRTDKQAKLQEDSLAYLVKQEMEQGTKDEKTCFDEFHHEFTSCTVTTLTCEEGYKNKLVEEFYKCVGSKRETRKTQFEMRGVDFKSKP